MLKPLFKCLGISLLTMAMPAFADDVAAAPPTIDSGNTAWILICSALVMLMTPGLGFFYAGMVSRKNVVSTLLQNYVALALAGIIWVVCGYSLVFTEGNAVIGGFGAVMLNGLSGQVYPGANIPLMAFAGFQMMFAIITPALITGSFAERVRFLPWLLILGSWTLLVYVPVAHWVWGPNGWIAALGGIDFAGGLVVHITAGFSGLVAALMYGQRYKDNHTLPNDIPLIMLGAALLWFGWFGFNAGSALTSGALASHAFMLTFIGGASSFLTWMGVDWIRDGRPTAVGAATGIVVGLVCITPAAGFVSLTSGMLMCAFAAIVSNLVSRYMKQLSHLDDALDVFACHGLAAFVGSVLTGALATKVVNPDLVSEGILISGESKVFMANLIGSIVVAVYAMFMTFVIIKIIGSFTSIRATAEEETDGLDKAMHGEYADHDDRASYL